MSITAFIQENIFLFAMTVAVLAIIITMEIRSFKTRGADVDATGLSRAVNDGATLVDLRRHDEFRAGHIAGAKNIPYEEFDNHLDTLGETDSDMVFYCYSGTFSANIIGRLRKQGYTNVKHLRGGINAWKADNLPTTHKG